MSSEPDVCCAPCEASPCAPAAPAASKIEGQKKIRVVDGVFLDTQAHSLNKHGKNIILKALEYKMLYYFLENRGRVITKDEFLQNVWEDGYVGDGTVAVHIRHLREKLEADQNEPAIIKTVWGVGYILEEEE